MDFAINSGPGRAIKELQKCLYTDVDGVIGPATLRKISDIQDMRGLCITYLIKRLVFMQNLSSWATQGKGWQNRLNTVSDNASLNWSVGGVTEPTKV